MMTNEHNGTYIAQYDWAEITPTTAVVSAVAAATDRSPSDIDALYNHIDPDALDTLLTPHHQHDSSVELQFNFNGATVTIRRDGSLTVVPE